MKFKVFCKKEIKEVLKTSKIFIIPVLFLIFGFMSPLLTKMMPTIFANIAGEFKMTLPEMSWLDSFEQLFKNINQMGLLVIILVFMGSVAEEKNKGTAIMVLSKPISKETMVLGKYLVGFLYLLISIVPAYLVCYLYTTILFPHASFRLAMQAMFLYLPYMVYVLALTIGVSAATKNQIAAGGLTLGIFFCISILSSFLTRLGKYLPQALLSYQHHIIRGTANFKEALGAILTSLLLGAFFLYLGIYIFKKQEV